MPPACRRRTCEHDLPMHLEDDNGRPGACIRLGCNCPRFKEGVTVMKIALCSLALLALALAAVFAGCDGAPLEPEMVAGAAGAAAAAVPCTYLPATTPSKVIPPTTWGTPPASWRYITCEDKKRALCIYFEGQYDLKVMDCSPAPGLTCAWTCE
jgi:hypothetical protein